MIVPIDIIPPSAGGYDVDTAFMATIAAITVLFAILALTTGRRSRRTRK